MFVGYNGNIRRHVCFEINLDDPYEKIVDALDNELNEEEPGFTFKRL